MKSTGVSRRALLGVTVAATAEYQWLDMPYCHQLPFADSHEWEAETRYPDFSSPEFAEWCDYVAREHCAGMKDDPKCCKRALRDARETLDTEALAAITTANAEANRWMRAAAEKG